MFHMHLVMGYLTVPHILNFPFFHFINDEEEITVYNRSLHKKEISCLVFFLVNPLL